MEMAFLSVCRNKKEYEIPVIFLTASVAGLSTAAFAQTNVTIYGVADVSAQGTNMSKGVNPGTTKNEGGSFNMKSNSSLIGFKGTEDLGQRP